MLGERHRERAGHSFHTSCLLTFTEEYIVSSTLVSSVKTTFFSAISSRFSLVSVHLVAMTGTGSVDSEVETC